MTEAAGCDMVNPTTDRSQFVMKSCDSKRRRAILDAADRLFQHYGPGKTTIGEIAKAVGIGVGSVYLEFESKEQIVAELAGDRARQVAGAMRRAARRGAPSARLGAALEARIEALFDLAREGAHACDLVTCGSGAGSVVRFGEQERELLREILEEGAAEGELAVGKVDTALVLLQRAYVSFSPPWLFEQDRAEVLRLVRALNRLLLDGLRARGSG